MLLEGEPGESTALDHLGVEVDGPDQVGEAGERLVAAGLATRVEDRTECCYALQDKVWVTDPGGAPWEVYTVLADSDRLSGEACCV